MDPDAPSGRANDHAAPARPQPLAWPRRAERTEPASHTPICPATADHLRYLRAPGKGGARLHRGFIHCRGLPRRAVNTRISPTVCGGTHGTRWLAVTQLPAGRVEAVRPFRTPSPLTGRGFCNRHAARHPPMTRDGRPTATAQLTRPTSHRQDRPCRPRGNWTGSAVRSLRLDRTVLRAERPRLPPQAGHPAFATCRPTWSPTPPCK